MFVVTDQFFSERLDSLNYAPEVKAYVIGVLNGYVIRPSFPRLESVVLEFAAAVEIADFLRLQTLGDWILWSRSVMPTEDNVEVLESVGSQSYAMCHRILRGQWRVYDDLSRTLPRLTRTVHKLIVP